MLGPPESSWEGAPSRPERDQRVARGGHAARASGTSCSHPARRAGARRLDQPRRAELRLPAADDPAGRGLRGGDVLRAVLARARAAGGRRTSAPTWPASPTARGAGGRSERRDGPEGEHRATGRRSGTRAPAWACASSRRRPCWSRWPARRRTRRGRARRAPTTSPACWPAGAAGRAAADGAPGGDPSLRLLRRMGVADPTSIDSYRAHGGYDGAARGLEMGPERVLREVTDSKLVGRGGAAFPTGRKWEAVPQRQAAALPDLQRRRVRAGHVQGPRDPRARPVLRRSRR